MNQNKNTGQFEGFLSIEEEKDMAQRYLNGESATFLAKEYGFKNSGSVIEKVHKYFPNLKEQGLWEKHTKEEEYLIAKEYVETNISVEELRKKYGYKTRKSITDKVKKYFPEYNVKKNGKERIKDYHLDFTEIDSPFKAYFLGLMLTDGYITDEIRFGIDLTDKDCIEFISKETGHNYKEYDYSPNLKELTLFGYRIKRKKRYRIIFSSRENCEQLFKWGIIPNKTYSLKGPDLSKISPKLYGYLLRGIIDGDGWITQITNQGSIGTFGVISASESFRDWVVTLCEKLGMKDLNSEVVEPREENQVRLYKLSTAKNDNMLILCDIYKNEFGMNRKRNKLRKMFRDYNGSSLNKE